MPYDIRDYSVSRFEFRSASALAREFAEANAAALISDGQHAVNDMVRAVEALWDVGAVNRLYLVDVLAGLLDEADAIQHEADRQLDDVGLASEHGIDKSEAEALLAQVRR